MAVDSERCCALGCFRGQATPVDVASKNAVTERL